MAKSRAVMNIEVLYFDGCPNHDALLPRLHELMLRAGVDAPVVLSRVESEKAALAAEFIGSPTLRINGQDVEPVASDRTDFGLKCRLYATADGLRGTIPDELILAALAQRRPD
jgi:hypothetical protein